MEAIGTILKKYWGYDSFRPLQEEIIHSLLEGRDTLAILPTGGGKSICFQVPAMAREGICIVVSPLIALMKDQVENLKKRGIPALLIHSGMQRKDVIQTLKNATHTYFKFLYVSPERLETSLFREFLPALDINFIAVDEAHCISQWGYDFRPSYLRIADLRKALPKIPILALTASATPEVQKDIREKLEFASDNTFSQSFERKNISYSVFEPASKIPKLVEILEKVKGTGIVYCKSRKRTKDIAGILTMHGISADHYHAGLTTEERNQKQQDWINDKTRVMVCTNAFGMGIDKPGVRTVIHVDCPDCLENYYQEAGRAGRDGNKSYTVLLYESKDLRELEMLHLTRYPSFEQIRSVYDALVNFLQIPVYTGDDQRFNFNFERFVKNFKLSGPESMFALKALEQDGWIEINEKSFSSSTLVFTTDREQLMQYQQAYPEHEALLTGLLRTYEGILDSPSFISESFMARLLWKEEEEIKQALKKIMAFGIIQYQPQNTDPQIIFRKNRVMAEELSFDHKSYNRRREVFVKRVNTMLAYVKTDECRSQFINHYFGDEKAKACGICDNCLKKKTSALSQEEFNSISKLIFDAIETGDLTIEALLSRLPHVQNEKTWQVIRFLQSEKKIRNVGGKVKKVV
jgi:ATP-dependent DNA helicase RecQ